MDTTGLADWKSCSNILFTRASYSTACNSGHDLTVPVFIWVKKKKKKRRMCRFAGSSAQRVEGLLDPQSLCRSALLCCLTSRSSAAAVGSTCVQALLATCMSIWRYSSWGRQLSTQLPGEELSALRTRLFAVLNVSCKRSEMEQNCTFCKVKNE